MFLSSRACIDVIIRIFIKKIIVDLDSQHYTAFPNKYYLLINIMLPSGWFCDSLVESDIWILILMLITHLDATQQIYKQSVNLWFVTLSEEPRLWKNNIFQWHWFTDLLVSRELAFYKTPAVPESRHALLIRELSKLNNMFCSYQIVTIFFSFFVLRNWSRNNIHRACDKW